MTKQTIKRFKMLTLLAMEIGVWEDKIEQLAQALETGHPQAMEALNFYEDKIIEAYEEREVTQVEGQP